MGLIQCASYKSVLRGYDYFKSKKVQNFAQLTETQYSAQVAGTAKAAYSVLIDTAHPRKSKCNCPHAEGRMVICKHMISVYFTAFPAEAQRIYETQLADSEEDCFDGWEEYCDDFDDEGDNEEEGKLVEYVLKMEKSELQQALLQVLLDGPNWQYERFIEEHYINE